MEASLEHMRRNTVRHIDTLLVVTEPYFRSLESARRLFQLAGEIPIKNVFGVANKVRSESEWDAIQAFFKQKNLALLAMVPYDDAVREADLNASALVDFAENSPAVRAVEQLLHKLTDIDVLQPKS